MNTDDDSADYVDVSADFCKNVHVRGFLMINHKPDTW